MKKKAETKKDRLRTADAAQGPAEKRVTDGKAGLEHLEALLEAVLRKPRRSER